MKTFFISLVIASGPLGDTSSQTREILPSLSDCINAVEAFTGKRPNRDEKYPTIQVERKGITETGRIVMRAQCVPLQGFPNDVDVDMEQRQKR